MKLELIIILSVASFSCLVTPTWGTGLLAAKGALLGAGALVAKGALLKGLAAKKAALNKPVIIIQNTPPPQTTSHHKPILEIKPIVEVNKPLLEVGTSLHSSILRWDSDVAIPALRLPFGRPPQLQVAPVTAERTSTVEVKPCPIPVSVPPKYPTVLNKVSGLWDLIARAVHFKKHALTGFIESVEPREKSIFYQIVRSPNSYSLPFEEEIVIGK